MDQGKITQTLSDVESYQLLNREELTDGEAFLVCTIGWCIELFQAYFLLYDYIMDGSHYRREGEVCGKKLKCQNLVEALQVLIPVEQ
ncbi:chrysanthemyl diphosphate synthase [Tanacetum coccineum]